ncbi:hypothetical protein FOCC_FOCC001786 [Frankliniella occidentalis]|nr:hypothetical protein FOCC_FOCC001786 [Frankliniella occidentalis]
MCKVIDGAFDCFECNAEQILTEHAGRGFRFLFGYCFHMNIGAATQMDLAPPPSQPCPGPSATHTSDPLVIRRPVEQVPFRLSGVCAKASPDRDARWIKQAPPALSEPPRDSCRTSAEGLNGLRKET